MSLPPGLNSSQEVVDFYRTIYEEQISSGQAFPFLYPFASLPALIIILYLLVDHRQSAFLRWCRYPLFTFIFLFEGWTVWCNRAGHPTASFGIGLVSAFGTLWSFGLICCWDCQKDLKRLELRMPLERAKNIIQRKEEQPLLHWQEYPQTVLHRLYWLSDLFCSFRGVAWTHQISQIPPRPKPIIDNLNHGTSTSITHSILSKPSHPNLTTTSPAGQSLYTSRTHLLFTSLPRLLLATLLIDLCKTLTTLDPYFWGYTTTPHFSKPLRLAICNIGLYSALHQIFTLGPIFFSLLAPSLFPLLSHPLRNPPSMFGPLSAVYTHGLAGWWGIFWHQTFRLAFTAPSTALLRGLGVSERGEVGKGVSLFVAFALSGVLHACGSFTQVGVTRPLRGPVVFFLLQAVGILVEKVGWKWVGKRVRRNGWVRGVVNFVFAHWWLYLTAELLMDDFARGGVWLYEPVPVSLFRGLGYGHESTRGWICWTAWPFHWHSGKYWWDTGIAF